MNPLTLYLEKKATDLKQQGQKKILIALFTGIGSAFSSLVGILASQLTEKPEVFYWGTVISSSIFIPASILSALSIWEKLKMRWSESDNVLLQMKYIREEYLIELQFLEKSGLDKISTQKETDKLYYEYRRKLSLLEVSRKLDKKYLNS